MVSVLFLSLLVASITECNPYLSATLEWLHFIIKWLSNLSISDWIAVAGVVASTILSITIGWIQYRQSEKMKRMEERYEQREESRHSEVINAKANNFIVQYGADKKRFPLCAIAALRDETFLYSNEIYRTFCCLPREVQNRVMERSGAGILITDVDNLEQRAIDCLISFCNSTFPNNRTPFYDNAKYVTQSIERYSKVKYESIVEIHTDNKKASLHNNRLYYSYMTGVLRAALEEHSIPERNVIDDLMSEYSFYDSCQEEACQFATTLACCLIVYSREIPNDHNSAEIGEIFMSDDMTLEDLFLAFLYAYYARYVE